MCGIVGYVGGSEAPEILLTGLKRLEYRGYDSAGMATVADGELFVERSVGHVRELYNRLVDTPLPGTTGIAHTRWATHGGPTESNAHPHVDATGRIAGVHNGIIENHAQIRVFLEGQGIRFASETDSEALVQLVGFFYRETGELLDAVRQALRNVRGTYGVVFVCAEVPDTLIAARRGSPLILGAGTDEFFVSSDANALVGYAAQISHLQDDEIVVVTSEGVHATSVDEKPTEKKFEVLDLTLDKIELGEFAHHMFKEIHEQPESLRNAMRGRVDGQSAEVNLGGLAVCEREMPRCRRVLLYGCGTAWHAAMIGKYLFEELAQIPTDVEYASELRYRNPIIEEQTLSIAISQSGETADTFAALREVKKKGAFALGIVNTVGSTVSRETDAGVYLHAGPEIGVASTKAFTAQVLVLTLIATYLGRRRRLGREERREILSELDSIPTKVAQALTLSDQIKGIAKRLITRDNWLYLGRGVNFPVALEGALKLKEVSYVHAEGMHAAEMKHGPIAMIESGIPVVVVAPRDHTYGKVLNNIEEVRSRGARVLVVANESDSELERLAHELILVPRTIPLLSPLVTSIPLQLLAYHAAVLRGLDVDKPRNLAKSVTVE